MIRRIRHRVWLSTLLLLACHAGNTTKPKGTDFVTLTPFRLAVFSDPHLLAPALLSPDPLVYALGDRKLLAESAALLDAMVDALLADPVDLVLIPGDLTKDGEHASHQAMAQALNRLEEAGMTVLVTPGNHDIANPNARSYATGAPVAVPSVTVEEFAQIYARFGYAQAVACDTASLSYAADPIAGLRVLALDACRYKENTDRSVVGGRFSEATKRWIEDRLTEARDQGLRVLAFIHHGLVPHFSGQTLFFSDYLLEDREALAQRWAELGLHVVFTGHFHAQDAAALETAYGDIVDVETGSLVTYPSPYRIIQADAQGWLTVTSERITAIAYDTGGLAFQDYARAALRRDVAGALRPRLIADFDFTEAEVDELLPWLCLTVQAHFEGDETLGAEMQAKINEWRANPGLRWALLTSALEGFYQDAPPEDNQLVLDLSP